MERKTPMYLKIDIKKMLWIGTAMGGFAWLISPPQYSMIERLLLLALLVVVPLGLILIRELYIEEETPIIFNMATVMQPISAILVVVSFSYPLGLISGLLTLPWLVCTILIGLFGTMRLFQGKFSSIEDACISVGLIYLPIGAAWLFASRAALSIMNYQEPIVLLTAVHFHFTGFAVPLIVGFTGQFSNKDNTFKQNFFRPAAFGVILSPILIALGFIFSPLFKVFAIFLLSESLLIFSLISVTNLPRMRSFMAQICTFISDISILIGMAFACIYGVTEFSGTPFMSMAEMASTHGAINALGFALFGLIGCIFVQRDFRVGTHLKSRPFLNIWILQG